MPTDNHRSFRHIVWPLAIAQTLLWAGAFYLSPLLLGVWERDPGLSRTEVTGAFTTALLLFAFLAPLAGRKNSTIRFFNAARVFR